MLHFVLPPRSCAIAGLRGHRLLPGLVAALAAGICCTTAASQVAPNWHVAQRVSGPPSRGDGVLVYDQARSEMLLFGGRSDGAPTFGDTWTYDGLAWRQQTPLVSPPPRYWAAASWDPVRRRVVLFGGTPDGVTVLGDQWEWDGSTWQQRTPALLPPPRAFAGMAFDPIMQRLVIYGGEGRNFGGRLNDTWLWDGSTWQQTPSGTQITAGAAPRLHWFGPQSRMLAFVSAIVGGQTIWQGHAYRGSSGWQRVPAADVAAGVALVSDPRRGLLVIPSAAPSVFDGTGWSMETPAFPRPSFSFQVGQAGYDEARAALVVFGAWKNRVEFYEDFTYEYRVPPPSGTVGAYRAYGQTCGNAGSLGRILLGRPGTRPALGGQAVLEVATDLALPSAPSSLMVLGAAPTAQTLPFLWRGCELLVQPLLALPTTLRAGFYELVLPIPNAPALLGAEVFAQDYNAPPASSCSYSCYTSNGLILHIGR